MITKGISLRDCKHGSIVQIGAHNYRVYRLEEFLDGRLGTMKMFARLQPCFLKNGHWWDDHNQKFEIHNWNESCVMVDDTNTAVAGEKFDTRKSA